MPKSLASHKVVTKLQGPTQVFPRKNVLCKLLCKHKFNAPFNPGYSLQQKIFLIDIKLIQLDKNLLEMLNNSHVCYSHHLVPMKFVLMFGICLTLVNIVGAALWGIEKLITLTNL